MTKTPKPRFVMHWDRGGESLLMTPLLSRVAG